MRSNLGLGLRVAGALVGVVVAVAALASCGSDRTVVDAGSSGGVDPSGAESPLDCPGAAPPPAEAPFVHYGADCEASPIASEWENDVPCEDVWRVGERLPLDFAGCAGRDGEAEATLLAWCDDESMVGMFTHEDMYAMAGTVIRRAELRDDGEIVC